MTIAAEPWTNHALYKPAFPKKNPYSFGILAIRVMLRNETADSIRVNLSPIRLSLVLEDDSRQDLPSLTSEQLADAVFSSKVQDPSRRSRCPVPLPSGPPIV